MTAEFNLTSLNMSSTDAYGRFLHHFVEVSKFTYGMRTAVGDAEFAPGMDALMAYMANGSFTDAVLKKLDRQKPLNAPSDYLLLKDTTTKSPLNDHGTTHVSIVDEEGNAASVTSTINL